MKGSRFSLIWQCRMVMVPSITQCLYSYWYMVAYDKTSNVIFMLRALTSTYCRITHCKNAIYLNLYFKRQQFEHEGLCFVSEIWWFKSIWWMDISKKIESFSHIYPICKHTSHSAPIWTFAIYTQNVMLYFFERFHTFCDTKNTWATILRHIYYYMW